MSETENRTSCLTTLSQTITVSSPPLEGGGGGVCVPGPAGSPRPPWAHSGTHPSRSGSLHPLPLDKTPPSGPARSRTRRGLRRCCTWAPALRRRLAGPVTVTLCQSCRRDECWAVGCDYPM